MPLTRRRCDSRPHVADQELRIGGEGRFIAISQSFVVMMGVVVMGSDAYRAHRSRPGDRCISQEMGRKVRAPSDTVPGNAWGARAHGKCNRKIPPTCHPQGRRR